MNILAIDTASNVCSVAVGVESGVIFEKNINKGLTHSELLIPMIEKVVLNANIEKKDINMVVVANGPGSFTGIRIGVTVANTFGQVLGIPVVGITALDSLAIGVGSTPATICPIIDAKGKKVYTALYKHNGGLNKISDYKLIDVEELNEYVKTNENKKLIFTGDGVLCYKDYIDVNLTNIKYEFADDNNNFQKASNLIKYVLKDKALLEVKTNFVNPFYIKKSQAEN